MTNRPAKKKNQVIKEDQLKAQEARRIKEQSVAKMVESILLENGFALQPFIAYSEYGIAPRVRLVEVNNTSNGQDSSEGEVEAAGNTDAPTEPVNS